MSFECPRCQVNLAKIEEDDNNDSEDEISFKSHNEDEGNVGINPIVGELMVVKSDDWQQEHHFHTKKDDKLRYKMERIPFLEEQVRKIKDSGKLLTMDIERLMLREDNRFDFVNEVAAEAISYVENNRDEYGAKKAILHVLSNRVNEAGFFREEAYMEPDPFKPGPTYLREEL
ncbi:protein PLASTID TRANSCRIPTIONALLY ACTIVE 7-like isoform X1 [Tasmannia lanceolata]|uniref:protein PLASTID TRANSCRIPTIONALLY ACTIVE 7-like isoform X1 n=1 Tax=Tasmannia lanceolata TaxID=3420 RepID=UPI00406300C0